MKIKLDGVKLSCESLIRRIFGDDWRSLSSPDIDGVWGVAIVRGVLDNAINLNDQTNRVIRSISRYLGVPSDEFYSAFNRLSINGVFLRDRIIHDRDCLEDINNIHAWCYYAGMASGFTGNVTRESRQKH